MRPGRPAVVRAGGVNPLWLLPIWYLMTRLFVVWLLSGPAAAEQRRVGGLLWAGYAQFVTIWDGQWYARIADTGYPVPLPVDQFGDVHQSEWAFYPLFPLLVRLVMAFGPPFWVAAELVNVVAAAACAWLAYRLLAAGRGHPGDRARFAAYRRAAAVTVGLWLLYPATTVLQIAYTEALALLLVLGVLAAMHRHRYGVALGLVLALGFARAVAAPLAFVVLVHLVLRWRRERIATQEAMPDQGFATQHVRRVQVRVWWFSGLAVFGGTIIAGVVWPVLVGWLTGRTDAFFAVQATWGQRPERGPFLPWWNWLSAEFGLPVAVLWALVLVTVCLSMLSRYGAWMPLELRAWGLAYPLYIFAVTAPSTSMIRFLLLDLPAFGVLAAVMLGDPRLGRVRRWWPVGPLLCLPVLAWTVYWWSTVVLVFTPPMDWPP